MYYFLSISQDYPNSYWLEYYRTTNLDSAVLLGNSKILPPSDTPIFYLRKKISISRFKKYDFLMTDAVPILSERLAEIYNRFAESDVQLILSHVYHNSEYIGNYYIPIYLKVINCIDWDRSIYNEKFNFFKQINILPDSLGDNQIVKAVGYQLGDPIIQDAIFFECQKKNIKGCSFYKNPYINPLFDI